LLRDAFPDRLRPGLHATKSKHEPLMGLGVEALPLVASPDWGSASSARMSWAPGDTSIAAAST
jgi:hypothetical protein